MAVEGEIWQRFYSTFKYFLPEDFIMNKRVKRPPDNPINSYLYFMMLEKNVCKRFLKFVKNTIIKLMNGNVFGEEVLGSKGNNTGEDLII